MNSVFHVPIHGTYMLRNPHIPAQRTRAPIRLSSKESPLGPPKYQNRVSQSIFVHRSTAFRYAAQIETKSTPFHNDQVGAPILRNARAAMELRRTSAVLHITRPPKPITASIDMCLMQSLPQIPPSTEPSAFIAAFGKGSTLF